jgi:hypothetical protein
VVVIWSNKPNIVRDVEGQLPVDVDKTFEGSVEPRRSNSKNEILSGSTRWTSKMSVDRSVEWRDRTRLDESDGYAGLITC